MHVCYVLFTHADTCITVCMFMKAQFLYSVATFCQALGQFVASIQGRQSVDGLMSGLGAKCWHKLRLKVPLNCFLSLHPGMSGSIVYSHNLETCQGMKCV